MKKSAFILLGIMYSFSILCQDHHIGGVFPTYNQNGKISSKFDYSIYTFLAIYPLEQRSEGFIYPAKTNAFYIELDAIYKLTEQWTFAGSYTYERANTFRTDYRNENRIWVQAQHQKKFEKVNLKNRLRYDLRFIQNRATKNTDFNPRLRYLLGFDFPLKNGATYLSFYNEFFFDTFENRISTYTENWAYAGVGFELNPSTKLEAGALTISWIRNAQKNWLHQYFLQLTLVKTIDLK